MWGEGGGRAKADPVRELGELRSWERSTAFQGRESGAPQGWAPRTRGATGSRKRRLGQTAGSSHSGPTEEDPGAVLEPSPRGLESEGKGQGSPGKATRRAGLPGSRGTRREDATGPRVPSSRRPGLRGAGNRERPRPEGPVTRSARTGPTPRRLPPASLFPPSTPRPVILRPPYSPAAAPEPAAASAAACASAAAAASLLRPSPGGASASRRRRLCRCRQSRTPQNGGTSGTYHPRGGPRRRGGRLGERTTAAPPARPPPARPRRTDPTGARRRGGRGRVPALQRPLWPSRGGAAAPKPWGPRAEPSALGAAGAHLFVSELC